MINNSTVRQSLFGLLLLLPGCSLFPEGTPAPPPELKTRSEFFQQYSNWSLSGKVGIKQGAQGASASFQWQQKYQSLSLALQGPLGQGGGHLKSQEGLYTLSTHDGQTLTDHDPDRLMAQATGLALPVSALKYWLRGLPKPGEPYALTITESGETLQQGPWTLNYQYRQWSHYPLPLPRKIVAQARINDIDYKITLVIASWELSP